SAPILSATPTQRRSRASLFAAVAVVLVASSAVRVRYFTSHHSSDAGAYLSPNSEAITSKISPIIPACDAVTLKNQNTSQPTTSQQTAQNLDPVDPDKKIQELVKNGKAKDLSKDARTTDTDQNPLLKDKRSNSKDIPQNPNLSKYGKKTG